MKSKPYTYQQEKRVEIELSTGKIIFLKSMDDDEIISFRVLWDTAKKLGSDWFQLPCASRTHEIKTSSIIRVTYIGLKTS